MPPLQSVHIPLVNIPHKLLRINVSVSGQSDTNGKTKGSDRFPIVFIANIIVNRL